MLHSLFQESRERSGARVGGVDGEEWGGIEGGGGVEEGREGGEGRGEEGERETDVTGVWEQVTRAAQQTRRSE